MSVLPPCPERVVCLRGSGLKYVKCVHPLRSLHSSSLPAAAGWGWAVGGGLFLLPSPEVRKNHAKVR